MSDLAPRAFRQRYILLIENDADIRDTVEQILSNDGYEVDAAGTLNDGIALLYSRRYDLVISDARLPDGSGSDLAGAAAKRGAETLIIMTEPYYPIELIKAVETALLD